MDNGLSMKNIKTKTKVIDGISKLETINDYMTSDSSVVAYLDNKVLIGSYKDGTFRFRDNKSLDFNFIQKMRIFNDNEELLLWRRKDSLNGRLRIDGEGEETDIVEVNQVLFGTTSEKTGDGYIKLSEERGTEIILPDKNYQVDTKKKRVAIKTRNYIGYTENLQATYKDVRFVKFIQLPEGGM